MFSKHRPSGPMFSISRFVRLCVCLSVCLSVCSLLRYRLTVFLLPLPEVGCPIFLQIWNPWGEVMERSGLSYEHFCLKIVENCVNNKKKNLHLFHFFWIFFGFRSFLTVFLPPLPEVRCPIFLQIRNPWGKEMESSSLRYEHFCLKIVENRVTKKSFFFSPLFSLFLSSSVFGLFNGLFAPTSRNRISNIFRDSEFLGKSNGKKWSQI